MSYRQHHDNETSNKLDLIDAEYEAKESLVTHIATYSVIAVFVICLILSAFEVI